MRIVTNWRGDVVKLTRTLHLVTPLMRGDDVKQLQVLLHNKGFKVVIDGEFGAQTADAVIKAKKKIRWYKLHPKKIGPFAGPTFVTKLTAYVPPARPKATKADEKRAKGVTYAWWLIKHEPSVHYQQWRPMRFLRQLLRLPVWEDCSESVTKIIKYAGGRDPNKAANDKRHWWDGLGYTGAMLTHCRPIRKSMLKKLDLIILGDFPGAHVCLVLDEDAEHDNADPLLFSHGQEAGPIAIKLSQEMEYHKGKTVHFLRGIED